MAKAIEITDLHAWYGESKALHGINLYVQPGEVVSLLGRNGAGRTTTLRALLGLVSARQGAINIHGQETLHLPTYQIARLGIGLSPEERGIFSGLSCEENLMLAPQVGSRMEGMPLADIYQMFPNLYERRHAPGTKMSGGEQQMLAIARILRTGADILLLDEISEGLAPVIVDKLAEVITELKKRNYTIVMVEQNFHFAAPLADRFYVIEQGLVAHHLHANELEEQKETLDTLLGV